MHKKFKLQLVLLTFIFISGIHFNLWSAHPVRLFLERIGAPPSTIHCARVFYTQWTWLVKTLPYRLYSVESLIKRDLEKQGMAPVRDLSLYSNVQEFLRRNKVYISLTTIPQRLQYIQYVLDSLDLTHVETIFLSLPRVFKRDKSTYLLPERLKEYPKLKILWVEEDLGPATKLIPAIELLKVEEPDALVITVDDDIAYPRGMVNELIYAATLFPEAVITPGGGTYKDYRLQTNGLEIHQRPLHPFHHLDSVDITDIDIVGGYAAVAYRPSLVNTRQIRRFIRLSDECFVSDDMTISLALRLEVVPMLKWSSPFYSPATLRLFKYAYFRDALHRGAARRGTYRNIVPLNSHTVHFDNYAKVLDVVMKSMNPASDGNR